MLMPLTAWGQNTLPSELIRADSLWRYGATQETIDAYEAILKAYPEAADDTRIRLARAWLAEGRWKKAAGHLDHVLKTQPSHRAARYYRAIAYREQGRLRLPLGQVIDFLQLDALGLIEPYRKLEKAASLFEDLLAEDSTYKETLYEYAQVELYRRRHRKALELAHAQVRLKPTSPEAHLGIFAVYNRLLRHAPKAAQTWFDEAPTNPYALYFKGEHLRRSGKYREAEAVYIQLVGAPGDFPLIPIYQSLARVYAALDVAPPIVEAQIWNAINAIASPVEAAFVLQDTKYILSNEEWSAYLACETGADYQALFRSIWAKRDPLPASRSNLRIAEHYQRLVHAERNFEYDGPRDRWRDQQRVGKPLAYPVVYGLNTAFNDKGFIYVRHGTPHDRAVSLQEHLPPNESWLYQGSDTQPEMIFHFLNAGGSHWQLVPALLHPQMLSDRAAWGHPFLQYTERMGQDLQAGSIEDQMEAMRAVPSTSRQAERFLNLEMQGGIASEMQRMSQSAVDAAFTTDRHVWDADTKPLPMATTVATFRGTNGETQVELFYAFSMSSLTQYLPANTPHVDVELGLVLQDAAWQPAARQVDRKRLAITQKATDGVLNGFRVQVPPATYRMGFHVQPRRTDIVGAFTAQHVAPDYTQPQLMLSDMVLAFQARPTEDSTLFTHGGYHILPNPTYRFKTDQTIYTYFEIYNLTVAGDDETHYTVAYTIKPQNEKRGLFRRRSRPALTLQTAYHGPDTQVSTYNELDVSTVEPGSYILTLTITDEHTGASVSKARPLVLY